MRYLIKEFGANEHYGYALHIVSDDGNELTTDSLWYWIRRAKREGCEISVYRIVNAVAFRDQKTALDILAVREDSKREFHGNCDRSTVETMKKVEPFTTLYNLECVVDLS